MKVKGNGGTVIVTDCGHQYNTAYPATRLAGRTTDCRICKTLLIFDDDASGRAVRGRDALDRFCADAAKMGLNIARDQWYYAEFSA